MARVSFLYALRPSSSDASTPVTSLPHRRAAASLERCLPRFPRHHHQKSQSRSPLSSFPYLSRYLSRRLFHLCDLRSTSSYWLSFSISTATALPMLQAASSARQRMLVCRAEELVIPGFCLVSNCEAVEVLQEKVMHARRLWRWKVVKKTAGRRTVLQNCSG